MAEVMPEPVRPGIHAALVAAAGDQLINPGGGQRFPVVDPEPQLVPPGLGVPGAGLQVPVEAPGGLVADLDDAVLAALASDGDLPLPQVDVAVPRVTGVVTEAGQLGQPEKMPVALNTAMIAVSRRWAKLRPAHACSSFVSSPVVKTGTSFSVTRGGCSPSIGSGSSSSAASHLKNCCKARYWLLA
jgi:hypothetical protein